MAFVEASNLAGRVWIRHRSLSRSCSFRPRARTFMIACRMNNVEHHRGSLLGIWKRDTRENEQQTVGLIRLVERASKNDACPNPDAGLAVRVDADLRTHGECQSFFFQCKQRCMCARALCARACACVCTLLSSCIQKRKGVLFQGRGKEILTSLALFVFPSPCPCFSA